MQAHRRHSIRTTLTAAILTILPLFALAGNPQDCGNDRMPPPGGMKQMGGAPDGMPPMFMLPPSPFDRLDLNEAQQKQIDALMQSQMRLIVEKQRNVRKTVLALRELGDADKFDVLKAKALSEAHGKAVGELAFLHAETQATVTSILTETQLKQLREEKPGCRESRP